MSEKLQTFQDAYIVPGVPVLFVGCPEAADLLSKETECYIDGTLCSGLFCPVGLRLMKTLRQACRVVERPFGS